jgi:septum formation topological specificity factor MinE
MDNSDANSQLRREILALIYRYGQESDVTVYSVLGVLDIVKADIIEKLTQGTET